MQPPRVQSPRRPRPRRSAASRGLPRADGEWPSAGAVNEGFEADTEAETDEVNVRLRRAEARNGALRVSESTEEDRRRTPVFSKEESRIVQAYLRQSLPQVVTTSDPATSDLPPPPPPAPPTDPSVSHVSDYDNVRPTGAPPPPPPPVGADPTEATKWESIMRLMNDQMRLRTRVPHKSDFF